MNERIKELAAQAGYNKIFDNDTKARARLEKFAELIVQECVGIVTETTNDSEWDGYNRATASIIMERLKS